MVGVIYIPPDIFLGLTTSSSSAVDIFEFSVCIEEAEIPLPETTLASTAALILYQNIFHQSSFLSKAYFARQINLLASLGRPASK